MYPVSQAFRAAVRGSHKATLRCEVWRDGQRLATVYPVSGRVDLDSRRNIRGSVQLEFSATRGIEVATPVYAVYADLAAFYSTYADMPGAYNYDAIADVVAVETETTYDPLVPGTSATDPLVPFGNEIRVWRGVEIESTSPATYATLAASYGTYGDVASAFAAYETLVLPPVVSTATEEVPLGVFVITEVDVKDEGTDVRISVQGEDRSIRVARNRWTDPYPVTQGTNVVDAVTDLLEDRYADVEVVAVSSTSTVGRAVLGQETSNDPWADARKIADAAGLDLFFDGEGRARLQPVASVEGATADAVYEEGADAVLLSLSRRLDAKTTYNGVIVTGEGTSNDTPVRAEAWDEDVSSPTYRYGPFGEVPLFYSSPLVTTVEQALETAEARLRKVTGLAEGIEWTLIADPSLEPGDVVQVVNPATRTRRVLVLDSVSIPLDIGSAMGAVGRTVSEVPDAA